MKNLNFLRKRLPFRALKKGDFLFYPFFADEVSWGDERGYIGMLVSSNSQETGPFRVITKYSEEWDNYIRKRYMSYERKNNCASLFFAEFPDRSWLYYSDEKREVGSVYSIALLPMHHIDKFDVVETKKFSAMRREIRTMLDYLTRNHRSITPVEHGIPHRGYIKEILKMAHRYEELIFRKEWDLNGSKIEVATDLDLPNLQFCLQVGYRSGLFFVKNAQPRFIDTSEHKIYYLTAFDYEESKAIHIARKEDKISGREFIYGFFADKRVATLFEEDQPLAEVEIKEEEWEHYIEDLIATQFNRLGDIVFWRKDNMIPAFLEKATWEELKENPKITIAEYSDVKIICHQEHGCVKVYPLEHPHRFEYKEAVID